MKIKVLSKKRITTDAKGKESIFYTYFTPVKIEVQRIHADGTIESLGIQDKKLSVHFTKVASKKLPDDDKVFAIIESKDATNIQLPFVFKINVKEDGSLEYPDSNECWVRDFDIYTPIEYTPKQSTCVPVIDEETEEEPVEIVE